MSDPASSQPPANEEKPQVAVGFDDVMDPAHAIVAARAADAKGAEDVVVLRVGDVLAITDYFVIASAPNTRLVRAIVQDIEEQVVRAGGPKPVRIEGITECEWVLMDFGTFVAHVFYTETRRYYELERLWGDVPVISWEAEKATASSN